MVTGCQMMTCWCSNSASQRSVFFFVFPFHAVLEVETGHSFRSWNTSSTICILLRNGAIAKPSSVFFLRWNLGIDCFALCQIHAALHAEHGRWTPHWTLPAAERRHQTSSPELLLLLESRRTSSNVVGMISVNGEGGQMHLCRIMELVSQSQQSSFLSSSPVFLTYFRPSLMI